MNQTLLAPWGLRGLLSVIPTTALVLLGSLAEVDLSVYDRGSYAGFGGPLPLLTASVPRGRLNGFLNWTVTGAFYERVWVNPGNLPAYRAPDRVREVGPTLQPSPNPGSQVAQNRAAVRITPRRWSAGCTAACCTGASGARRLSRPSPLTTRRTRCTSRCSSTCCGAAVCGPLSS
ncbi:hypothetical protein DAERI_010430 [Deinococcus aerius]|uniref:Uncharacterized protein n=1 Tax=Deinococcus aerius TaxID=200253 RepID=A0A2I9DE84_9DEIO|nr:hypothetical protein DAERI_010430 [Deinococcus aerius]